MAEGQPVLIEAAINGGRSKAEHPGIPYSPAEIAAEARRSAEAGAAVVHLHARTDDGAWTADPGRYAETIAAVRAAAPGISISITSLRPAGVPVEEIVDLLAALAASAETRPDLISLNLGHGVVWEPAADAAVGRRRTRHYPNDYEDVAALLAACAKHGIVPELALMDTGFLSNAVALLDDRLLPEHPWFLLELDSPGYGAGPQVAPSTVDNYVRLAEALAACFPATAWAAHGHGEPGYAVIERALTTGAHVRVGFEDALTLPGGARPESNGQLVEWAAAASRRRGREPMSARGAARIVGV